MAHIGTVGEVVGAEFAGEELVEEGGFVACAAGGVEDGLVGGVQCVEVGCDLRESFVPGDGLIVCCVLWEVHGMGDAAHAAEVVVGGIGEVYDGVFGLCKEGGDEFFCGGFFGDGF